MIESSVLLSFCLMSCLFGFVLVVLLALGWSFSSCLLLALLACFLDAVLDADFDTDLGSDCTTVGFLCVGILISGSDSYSESEWLNPYEASVILSLSLDESSRVESSPECSEVESSLECSDVESSVVGDLAIFLALDDLLVLIFFKNFFF